jgi:hypothetical protein
MRRAVAGLAAALALVALPHVAAGLLVWTFVVTPLTVTAGQATVFTMTATNALGPDDLGCLEVTLPSSFSITSVSDPVPSNGGDWMATVSGNTVEVNTDSGGDRLEIGDSVTFQVKATPTVAGATSWPNHAHRQQDCSGTTEVGVPVLVTVLPAILATPAPTVRPTPTPRPTPAASPIPSLPVSLPPLPSLLPSASSAPTTRPSDRPAATSASASPSPGATATPGGGAGTPSTPADGSGQPSPAAVAPRIPPADAGPVQVSGGTLTVLDGFDTWSVPAAVVGVPGLLVVLWVALQTVGALAWIPAVRRLRGEDRRTDPRQAR